MTDLTNLVGQILDNQYRIEKILGQGGMGAVYKAYHIKLGDIVAIKMMPPHVGSNPENQRRFFREGQAARRFKHPNAITLYDLRETDDGILYMVLEYIEGINLRSVIDQKGCFSAKEALEIIEPVASALNEAHKLGVIHRDIKPENIMVKYNSNNEPVIKLLDLGIAKIIGTTTLTVEGQVLGSPYYMSPEQWGIYSETEIEQKSVEIDGRADIYSLGVILYEMVTGQRPFTGGTLQELAIKHITSTPTAAKKLNPDLSELFSQTIGRAISKERVNRPVSCQELIEQLHSSLQTEEFSNQRPSTLPISEITDVLNVDNKIVTASLVKGFVTSSNTGNNIGNNTGEVISNSLSTKKINGLMLADTEPILDSNKVQSPFNRDSTTKIKKTFLNYSKYLSITVLFTAIIFLVIFYSRIHPSLQEPVLTINDFAKTENMASPLINPVEKQEIIRYWLEIVTQKGNTLRKTKDISIDSGDIFQFHIQSKKPGYLYILMPGEKSIIKTLLTSKPIPETGVKDNSIQANTDYKFPNGKEWLTIGKADNTNKFIVIFSLKAIESVPFLNKTALHILSEEENIALTLLRKKSTAIETETVINNNSYVVVNSINPLKDMDYIVCEIEVKLK